MKTIQNALTSTFVASTLAITSFSASATMAMQSDGLMTQNGAEVVDVANTTLKLEVGKGKLIKLARPASDIFIVEPGIADVQVKSERIVYVYGVNPGATSFFALDENDNTIFSTQISVTRNIDTIRKMISNLLPDRDISLQLVNDSIVLMTGSVASPDESNSAEAIAQGAFGDNVQLINKLDITQPTQVNMRVRFAEVSRSIVKDLGFNWEGGFFKNNWGIGIQQGRNVADVIADPITGLPTKVFQYGSTPSLFGDIDIGGTFDIDLNYALDMLDQEGFLNMLAEPNLTAQSGQSASFLAGGEYPIPIFDQNRVTVEYKEYGVRLGFTPRVLDTGRIEVLVAPEVSQLTTTGAVEVNGFSIPALTSRRAETTVNLGSGQSFAIAGLLQNTVQDDSTKIPGLGDLPILGTLFRSNGFRRNETELLIVVTPYAVRPISNRQVALPTDGFVAPTDMQRFLQGKKWKPNLNDKSGAKDIAGGPSRKKRAGFQLN